MTENKARTEMLRASVTEKKKVLGGRQNKAMKMKKRGVKKALWGWLVKLRGSSGRNKGEGENRGRSK